MNNSKKHSYKSLKSKLWPAIAGCFSGDFLAQGEIQQTWHWVGADF